MTVVVIVIVGFFIWQLKAKNRFDRLRAQVSQVTLSKVSMDEAGETLLATVKGAWKLQTQEVPDSVFSEIASMTGLPESVAGVAEFFTHEIPEFSFFSFSQNADEAVMALAMAVALPTSVDGKLYKSENVCFVKIGESCVEVFENTKKGLRRSLYYQSENETSKGENGGGGSQR